MGYVAALGVLVAALFAPAWVLWDDDPGVAAARAGLGEPTPGTIVDYDARFELAVYGDLAVEESLVVELPPYDPPTGFTRYFDRVDGSDERARRRVRDVTATLDGDPVPVRMTTAGRGRFDVATIGDPDVDIGAGRHRVVIRYQVRNVLEPGEAGEGSALHWDLLPASWPQDVGRSELTVELPEPPLDVECGIGPDPSPPVCDDVSGQDTTTLVVRTGELPGHTPVRVRLGLTTPLGKTVHLPWEPRYDVVLGQSRTTLALVLGGALLAGLLGLLLARRNRPRPPGGVRSEEPPAGLGPAQEAYLLRGRVDGSAYAASLAHAAQHGAVDLVGRDDTWVVADRSSRFGWAGLDPVTTRVAHLLGGPGTTFVVDPSSAASGERLTAEVAALDTHAEEWARAAGLVEVVRPSRLLALVVPVGLAAAAAAVLWNPLDMSIAGLVPGALAIGALPLARTAERTRLTSAGREVAGAVAGGETPAAPAPDAAGLEAAVAGALAAYDVSRVGGAGQGGRRRSGARRRLRRS